MRKHETAARARDKAVLTEARHGAERQVAEAAEQKEIEAGRFRVAADAESVRLRAGVARAGDLAQAERFRNEAKRGIEIRQQVEDAAVRKLAEASRQELRATSELAAALASEKAVTHHEARFRDRERRSAERREEHAVEEAVRARRGRPEQKRR